MDPPVPLQVGAPGKTFPTVPTLVGLISSVAFAVPLQCRWIIEAFPTLGATIRLLASRHMDPLVGEQSGADAEAFPAVRALVWPLPCVSSLVDSQV